MRFHWPHLPLLGTAVLLTALCSCSLISDIGPLKSDVMDDESERYKLVRVETDQDIPAAICSYSKANLPPQVQGEGYSDKIRERDSLMFVITDLAKQSPFSSTNNLFNYGPIEVPADGTVSIPYLGTIKVSDHTLSSVTKTLEDKIAQVSKTARVNVARVGRVPHTANVIGRVHKPGPVPLERSGITSHDLLAASGGPILEEHLLTYTLRRAGKDYHFDFMGWRHHPFIVEQGDLLMVDDNPTTRFHVMGAVTRPSTTEFPNPCPTLADAIGEARGFDERRSNPSGVFIFRKGNPATVYSFNMKDPDVVSLTQRFPMRGEDIVYVTEAPMARWNRLITQILPVSIAQGANATARYTE